MSYSSFFLQITLLTRYAEVVLVTLLSTFKFELPKDKSIVWNVAGVRYPTVGYERAKAEMPLKLTML